MFGLHYLQAAQGGPLLTAAVSRSAYCQMMAWCCMAKHTAFEAKAKGSYRCLFEQVVETSCLPSHVPVIVSGQIAHGAVELLQLLHILRQPV